MPRLTRQEPEIIKLDQWIQTVNTAIDDLFAQEYGLNSEDIDIVRAVGKLVNQLEEANNKEAGKQWLLQQRGQGSPGNPAG